MQEPNAVQIARGLQVYQKLFSLEGRHLSFTAFYESQYLAFLERDHTLDCNTWCRVLTCHSATFHRIPYGMGHTVWRNDALLFVWALDQVLQSFVSHYNYPLVLFWKQSYKTCQNLFVTFGRRFVHFKISLKILGFFFSKFFFNKTRTSILESLVHTFLTNRQKRFPLDGWVKSLAMIMN